MALARLVTNDNFQQILSVEDSKALEELIRCQVCFHSSSQEPMLVCRTTGLHLTCPSCDRNEDLNISGTCPTCLKPYFAKNETPQIVEAIRHLVWNQCDHVCGAYYKLKDKIIHNESCSNVDMTCPICEDSVKNFETTELMTRHLNEAEQHMEQFCLQKENPDTSFGQFGQRRRVTPISRNTVNISVVKDEHGKAIDGSYTGIIHHSEMFELRLFFLIWAKTTTDGVHFGISLLAPNDNKYHGELQASLDFPRGPSPKRRLEVLLVQNARQKVGQIIERGHSLFVRHQELNHFYWIDMANGDWEGLRPPKVELHVTIRKCETFEEDDQSECLSMKTSPRQSAFCEVNFKFRSTLAFERVVLPSILVTVDELRDIIYLKYGFTVGRTLLVFINPRTCLPLTGFIHPNADIVGVRLPAPYQYRRQRPATQNGQTNPDGWQYETEFLTDLGHLSEIEQLQRLSAPFDRRKVNYYTTW